MALHQTPLSAVLGSHGAPRLCWVGEQEEPVADLASAIGADPGNSAREVVRLEHAAIVVSRRDGRTKLVRANVEAPFYEPPYDLVTVVLGPAAVLAEHLGPVEGIVFADIFA